MPVRQNVLGRVVHGASRPWGKLFMSMGQNVPGPHLRGGGAQWGDGWIRKGVGHASGSQRYILSLHASMLACLLACMVMLNVLTCKLAYTQVVL
jgi:hypothetical protein